MTGYKEIVIVTQFREVVLTACVTHRCKVDGVTVVAVGPVLVLVEDALWEGLETLHTPEKWALVRNIF